MLFHSRLCSLEALSSALHCPFCYKVCPQWEETHSAGCDPRGLSAWPWLSLSTSSESTNCQARHWPGVCVPAAAVHSCCVSSSHSSPRTHFHPTLSVEPSLTILSHELLPLTASRPCCLKHAPARNIQLAWCCLLLERGPLTVLTHPRQMGPHLFFLFPRLGSCVLGIGIWSPASWQTRRFLSRNQTC